MVKTTSLLSFKNSENIWKCTPLNYTSSYKQNKVFLYLHQQGNDRWIQYLIKQEHLISAHKKKQKQHVSNKPFPTIPASPLAKAGLTEIFYLSKTLLCGNNLIGQWSQEMM